MREFDGHVRGINNSPTTSVASGSWSVNAAATYIRNLTRPAVGYCYINHLGNGDIRMKLLMAVPDLRWWGGSDHV